MLALRSSLLNPEPFGEVGTDLVAVEQRDVPTELGQTLDQGEGHSAFARPREADELDRRSPAEFGRVGFAEDLRDGGAAEPLRLAGPLAI